MLLEDLVLAEAHDRVEVEVEALALDQAGGARWRATSASSAALLWERVVR